MAGDQTRHRRMVIGPNSPISQNMTEDDIKKYLELAANLTDRIESYNMYRRILDSYPGNATAALAVSEDLTRRRRFVAAFEIISSAVDYNLTNAELWREKARTGLRAILPNSTRHITYARSVGGFSKKDEVVLLKESLSAIENAIKLEPKNSSNYKIQADIFKKMGSEFRPRIIKALQKAAQLDPKDPDTWTALSDMLYDKDHEAITLLQTALKQNPTAKEEILHRLYPHYVNLKKYTQAIDVMKQYEKIVGNGHGWGHIGDLYGDFLGKTKQALEAYDKGLEKNPKDVEIFVSKIELLNKIGKSKDALKECKKFRGEWGADISFANRRFTISFGWFTLAKAETLYAVTDYEEALVTLQAYTSVDEQPNSPDHEKIQVEMHRLAGKIHHDMGNYQLSINAFNRALSVNPDDVNTLYNKFELQGHLGNPNRELLIRAHKLDPDNSVIIAEMIDYAKDDQELKRIGEVIKQLVKKEPKNIDNIEILAEYYAAIKENKKEIQTFEKLHRIQPDNIQYLDNLLSLGMKTKNKTLSKKYFLKLKKLIPNDWKSIVKKGKWLIIYEHYKEALSIYEKGIVYARAEHHPDALVREGLAWLLRGTALAGLKRYDEAIDSLIASIALSDQPDITSSMKKINNFLTMARANAIKKHPRWKLFESMVRIAKKRYSSK